MDQQQVEDDTVQMIDAMIMLARQLSARDLSSEAAQDALSDWRNNHAVQHLLNH